MLQRACRPNAGAALRLPARSGRVSAPRWTRPYSAGRPSSPFTAPKLIGVFVASAAGGWALSSLRPNRGKSAGTIPSLGSGPVDLDALARTPVDGGSFEKADAKLREDVFVGSFAAEGQSTHLHAARVASNHPVEDYMAYSLAPGVGSSEALFNGVYDGHA